MKILVLNSGSSSFKFSVFERRSEGAKADVRCVLDGTLSGIGEGSALLEIHGLPEQQPVVTTSQVTAKSPEDAIRLIFDAVCRQPVGAPDAVGYRVVHPGAKLDQHQRITATVLQDLEEAAVFAPLHDPTVVAVIRQGMARFPDIAHYACFDTVFHQTMPEEAVTYPLPRAFRDAGVRRYGFHGLSCESVVRSMRAGNTAIPKRMAIAHLGSGCSVTALLNGRSVDTTMGLTPTGGIVMGTRPGDLDPGVILYLLRQKREDDPVAVVEAMLNHESGLVAITDQPNDMQLVRKAAEQGDERAVLGLRIFTRSITKAIGGFCWLLGGLDAIVFTGGIGEHDVKTRVEVLADLESLGITIDSVLNESGEIGNHSISTPESRTKIFVVPAQEDLMIALHVSRMYSAEK